MRPALSRSMHGFRRVSRRKRTYQFLTNSNQMRAWCQTGGQHGWCGMWSLVRLTDDRRPSFSVGDRCVCENLPFWRHCGA